MLADDPQGRVAEFDGDGLAGVAEADLDALAGNLDAAAAGDLPLDGQAGLRQRVWPGEADALGARWVSRTRGFTVTDGTAGMCADLERHWLSLCPALISKLMVRPTWTLGQEGIASLPGATRSGMIALMPPSIRVRAIVLDCPDPLALSGFYAELLDWPPIPSPAQTTTGQN